eukprot:11369476-Alexandrium_andersonii.AAC.1
MEGWGARYLTFIGGSVILWVFRPMIGGFGERVEGLKSSLRGKQTPSRDSTQPSCNSTPGSDIERL